MSYNQPPSYPPVYDLALDPPISHVPQAQIDDRPPPMFIPPASINVPSLQPPPSPGTSDGIGSASAGESLQSSPLHSAPIMYQQEPTPELSRTPESTPNYFGKGHFQPQSTPSDMVSKFEVNSYNTILME